MNSRLSMLKRMHPFTDRYRGADLSGQDLSNYCFVQADMGGTNLSGCDLSNADFTGANLKDADLSGAILNNTHLCAADLRGANVRDWHTDMMGRNTLGIRLDYQTVQPETIVGAHDCHELIVAAILKHFGRDDLEMLSFAECTIARFITCWHGGVIRFRQCWPHRLDDIRACWNAYPNMCLSDRWALGERMADCETLDDWHALRDTDPYKAFPRLAERWIQSAERRMK